MTDKDALMRLVQNDLRNLEDLTRPGYPVDLALLARAVANCAVRFYDTREMGGMQESEAESNLLDAAVAWRTHGGTP